ncbi:hypothetical protein FEZ51_07660 [Pediococcus stilesii]|uniref:SAP domain-containing protein n=1 Tax=Pediococcus stilesii TaxID=331679 RepID=A0A5R9BST0_9LACO|nr:SAP domain-containing protein [Pediococcus stilesii]TLQ03778.1 hypothetical protein FEZ51_07660 [Pediococcus stilesii]
MNRPVFNGEMNTDVFKSFYWYKKELEQICREYKLPSYGTKAELSGYVVQYLDGVPLKKIKSVRKVRRNTTLKLKADQITLETKLLNTGFSLNNEVRTFFGNYFGVEKFSFCKPMGVMMREIERNGDTQATVADLISCLNDDKVKYIKTAEEKTYQWNNFVKSFRHDPYNSIFHSQMKVASIIWGVLRDSNKEKVYSRKLVKENIALVKKIY